MGRKGKHSSFLSGLVRVGTLQTERAWPVPHGRASLSEQGAERMPISQAQGPGKESEYSTPNSQ